MYVCMYVRSTGKQQVSQVEDEWLGFEVEKKEGREKGKKERRFGRVLVSLLSIYLIPLSI